MGSNLRTRRKGSSRPSSRSIANARNSTEAESELRRPRSCKRTCGRTSAPLISLHEKIEEGLTQRPEKRANISKETTDFRSFSFVSFSLRANAKIIARLLPLRDRYGPLSEGTKTRQFSPFGSEKCISARCVSPPALFFPRESAFARGKTSSARRERAV